MAECPWLQFSVRDVTKSACTSAEALARRVGNGHHRQKLAVLTDAVAAPACTRRTVLDSRSSTADA